MQEEVDGNELNGIQNVKLISSYFISIQPTAQYKWIVFNTIDRN